MTTLTSTIRRLTAASTSDVSDGDVLAALAANRVRETSVPIEWERVIVAGDSIFTRGRFRTWGLVEPVTQATAAANLTTITLGDGTAASGNYTMQQDGSVVFATDQAPATSLLLSAYSYDVHAACADVVDQLAALCVGDYDVKLGDQSFSRSQGVAALREFAASFRRRALPARVELVRADEAASPRRVRRRAGWR
jgi:hypothetical protein